VGTLINSVKTLKRLRAQNHQLTSSLIHSSPTAEERGSAAFTSVYQYKKYGHIAHKSNKTNYQGCGLGLDVSVEMHQRLISVSARQNFTMSRSLEADLSVLSWLFASPAQDVLLPKFCKQY